MAFRIVLETPKDEDKNVLVNIEDTTMFTEKESSALLEFLERVDAYDYVEELDGLESALDKIYDMLETDQEKSW